MTINENIEYPLAYVTANRDPVIREQSTSGGFFSAIAMYVLEKLNGVVVGVQFDEQFHTQHICINNVAELKKLNRSKYIQSNIGDIYTQIKKLLNLNRIVLFSGTPCQVEGLKMYLEKEYSNLICCDVVCRGVISPKLWNKHIKELKDRFNEKIEYIGFREKKRGFHKSKLTVNFVGGKKYAPSTDTEWISRFFSSGVCLRPSCYNCVFKTVSRVSDFTMFDCWNVSRLVDSVEDDDKGYTNVFIHSKKGNDLFKCLKPYLYYWIVDAKKAELFDGVMIQNCAECPDNRDEFYEKLNSLGIKDLGKRVVPIPFKVKLKEIIKKFIRY